MDPVGVDIAEISLSCANLRNRDWLSKSDPFVVLFVQPRTRDDLSSVPELLEFQRANSDSRSSVEMPGRITCATGGSEAIWHYVGETEVVWNDLSPSFVAKLRVPFSLVPKLHARFEVYDMDDFEAPLAKQDFLGFFEAPLQALAFSRNSTHPLSDKKGRQRANQGTMRVCIDRYDFLSESDAPMSTVRVVFSASSGIDPGKQVFFTLSRAAPLPSSGSMSGASEPNRPQDDEQAGWVQLHRSGALSAPSSKREFSFQDASVREDVLMAGDSARFLRLELYLHRPNGSHMRIGGTRTFTLGMLRDSSMAGRQRLVPDVASGASLRSADYTAEVSLGAGNVARSSSGTMFGFTPSGPKRPSSGSLSPLRSSGLLASSEIQLVFRFGNLLWWPAAKKDTLLRQLSRSRAR